MEDAFAEIRTLIEAGKDDEARGRLREIIKAAPSAEAYFLASKVAYNEYQTQSFLEKAIELDPFHVPSSEALQALKPPAPPPVTMQSLVERKIKDVTAPKTYALADFIQRAVAYVIDSLIAGFILAVPMTCWLFSMLPARMTEADIETFSAQITRQQPVITLLSIVVLAIYHAYFMVKRNGQTPGKSVMRIRVVRKDGAPLSWTDSLVRCGIGYTLSGVFLIGFFWALLDAERQGFHDKIANTVVVKAQ
jgi:uncharacterized RDD family membrane protein YckC